MTAADAIDVIRMAKNVTRTATLGLFAISVIAAFIFTLAKSPEADAIDFISNIISGAIIMLAAHAFLHLLYRFAKDQEKETAKEPEENKDGNDG